YFNQFANALEGLDLERPGVAIARTGKPTPVPRVIGPIRRARPVLAREMAFLRGITDRPIKVTVPGPFTLAQLAEDEHYREEERLAMAYAAAVNEELRELEPLVDALQLDEPYLQARPDRARAYAVAAIDRALAGITKLTCVHLCFGYAFTVKDKPSGYSFLPELDRCAARQVSIEAAQPGLDLAALATLPSKTIVLGVLDLGDPAAETAEMVAGRLGAALVVQGRRIAAIGPTAELLARYPEAERVDGRARAVLPGFANTHTHFPMTLARGIYEDLSPPHSPPFSGGLAPLPLPPLGPD